MAWPDSVVAHALLLASEGLNATGISNATSVPRRTIVDWLARRTAGRPRSTPSCLKCGGRPHPVDALPESYLYLLGLFLGDGCLSRHARDVYKLRLYLDAKYPNIVNEAATAIQETMPTNQVARYFRRYGDIEVYSYSKSWPCLFPQH